MARGGFFAVGRDAFAAACALGVTEAAAFLVLASGTGGDNATTSWSAEAASQRLRVRWSVADAAVKRLHGAKLATRTKGGTRPSYKLAAKGDPIWLPNALVEGVGAEVAPVARLRQTQDPMALRLLVDLYGAQNLREDGGVSPKVVWKEHDRERLGQRGAWVAWRFGSGSEWVNWQNPVTPPHLRRLTDAEREEGVSPGEDLFRRTKHLVSLGLIEWVPYLFEGPEGEPIHPLHWNSTIEEEAALYRACSAAAGRCLTPGQHEHATGKGGWWAAVPAHIEQVRMVSVARLRYRPHTSMTGAWWANHIRDCRDYAERYAAVAAESKTDGAGAA